MNKKVVETWYCKDDLDHRAVLSETKTKMAFTIEAVNDESGASLKDLFVVVWPVDYKAPPYQFRFLDRAKHVLNPLRADFVIPIDDRETAPPYFLSVFSDDNKVNLKDWRFFITWEPSKN